MTHHSNELTTITACRPLETGGEIVPESGGAIISEQGGGFIGIGSEGHHPFVPDGEEHVLRRAAPDISDAADFPAALYQVPNLKTVDLSWAGRLGPGHPSLTAISAAKARDPLKIVRDGSNWMMRDSRGQALGRMAKSWSPPEGLSFLRGEVGAIG